MSLPLTAGRLDKWLWSVRLYKTRSVAIAACQKGRVRILDQPVKPSRAVRLGESITVVTGELRRKVRVVGLIDHRVSASQVSKYMEDLTPPEEFQRAKDLRPPPGYIPRPTGSGRPTKKERREIDGLS